MSRREARSFFVILLAILSFVSLKEPGVFAQSVPFQKNSRVPAAKISESEASQVLILGTVHLRTYEDDFNRDVLDELLNVLERYKPELIGIESLAPIVLRDMVNSGEANAEILKEFGKRSAEFGIKARSALQMSWVEAKTRIDEMLEDIGAREKDINIDQIRKELVLHFLAVNDIYSALLQWSYLTEDERTNISRLDTDIQDYFSEHIQSSNENVSIGIALATRLNHQKIYAINDHRDKEDFVKIADALSIELENNEYLKNQPWKTLYEELTEIQNKSYAAGDLLPLYTYLNSKDYVLKDIDSQWQILFKAKLPSGLGQTRVAYWDVRNLGIAANIRRVMALNPGKKMLVVIGASHKGFLDALLAESMDVKVVQLADIVHTADD